MAGRALRSLSAVLLALAGFAGTNALVHPLLARRPELRLLRGSPEAEKLEHLRRHADDYDLVYLGTSRVHHGFDAAAFDARMAALGRPTSSFELGLVGLDFLEESYLERVVLAHRSPRLQRLLIEPTEREVLFERANRFSARLVSWHDVETTRLALESTWRSPDHPREKVVRTRLHLLHALHRTCNVGVGANVLDRVLGGPPPGGAGDAPVAEREGDGMIRIPVVLFEAVGAMARRARAAGVQPILAVPPTNRSMEHFRLAAEKRAMPRVLLFGPDDLPELFSDRAGHFRDPGHLNERGARLYSERLAEILARTPDGGGGRPAEGR